VLRKLPRVDDLLAQPLLAEAAPEAPRALIRCAARAAIADARARLRAGAQSPDISAEVLAARAADILRRQVAPSLRRVINATGVILHTGLGRAPLAASAGAALAEISCGYCNVQVDLESGDRSQREDHVQWLLQELTGAEAALVVNNNAAATVLALNTLAGGREVVLSRGELVEIGGAFRMPEIMALAGCRLVEVGCTNRTHLRDYQAAITPETALLLCVHQSNYRLQGFTSQTPLAEVATLARAHGIMCAHDLGSGALLDLRRFGLPHEPTAAESLTAGADAVFFSGDKLLGGPQCGIILGRRKPLQAMHENPYYRIFRVDKLTLAALEATLRLFLDAERLPQKHALMSVLTRPLDEIRVRAQELARRIAADCGEWLVVEATPGESQVGGGSLAGHTLPTFVVSLRPAGSRGGESGLSPGDLAWRLRQGEPPIVARIHEDAVLLDLRTVLPDEDQLVGKALAAACRALPT